MLGNPLEEGCRIRCLHLSSQPSLCRENNAAFKNFWFYFLTLGEVFPWIYSTEDKTSAKRYLWSVRGRKDPLSFHPCSPASASLPCHSLPAWVQGAVPGQSPDAHIQERRLKGKESPKAYCSIVWMQPAEEWFPRLCQVNDFKHSSPSPILMQDV